MVNGRLRQQHNVATHLADFPITPIATKMIDEVLSVDVSGKISCNRENFISNKAHNSRLRPVKIKGFDNLLHVALQVIPVGAIGKNRFSATDRE